MRNNRRTDSILIKMLFLVIFVSSAAPAFAQEDPEKTAREARKYMKEAEEALAEDDFATAEAYYRQAIAKDPGNAAARYNLGNLYYNKDINHEAVERHSQAAEVAPEKPIKHNSFHNQGNALMKQKKYKEAIEAYKNALRNNPTDDETRYNLALAKKMLEKEQDGDGGEDDQNQGDQDQQDQQNQDNKDQQGDQGEQEQNEDGEPQDSEQGDDQENKEKKEGDDEKENQGDPNNQENQDQKGDKPKEQQQQPVPGQLSPQQVKNLLEAMGNEEKKVQDKINAEKSKGAKTRTEKDW